ncbi:hypothetical protein G7Z17_g8183 [Cylindrodendrum hubeiense]|uniref:HPt domain-containing protein n=1 Tax=Cylindrodendrum hubeiense TaxID=595255 RepID=A0A9P5LEK8_9HYPO|nr:hypothetical protein G7Z17_g8183 [Cylindrodendrum hubeiense]
MSPPEEKTTDETVDLGACDGIDMNTFSQILEMDEPGDHEFSYGIVFDFFDQVEETFETMDKNLEDKDLLGLYSLGHFLKGSSATLGLVKVRDGCEKIQRYGKNENLDGSPEKDSELCLKRIGEALKAVKTDFAEVETVLRKYYNDKE